MNSESAAFDSAEELILEEEADDNQEPKSRRGRAGGASRRNGGPGSGTESLPVLFEYRIVVLGDPGVGKSELVGNLIGQPYAARQPVTAGNEMILFKSKVFPTFGYAIKAEFWDTPGACHVREQTARLCSDLATAFILVFDLTSEQSYKNLEKWISAFNLLRDDGQFRCPAVLLGNKVDQADEGGMTVSIGTGGFGRIGAGNTSTSSSAAASMININLGVASGTTTTMPANGKPGGAGALGGVAADVGATKRQDSSSLPKRAVQFDDAQAWAMDRGAEYYEVSALNSGSLNDVIITLIKSITRQLPAGASSDPKSLIDMRIRPVKPLPHGKHIEYKNRLAIQRKIRDTTDTLDWL
ncbi:P-loop containing nucleoside triphosphate hydrolase protein [Catenaria anguillulae PL171]|uniref:p-loop containing nucleoside triphosphate hydrolase protein n=1 Tax=Catenaria anguillulae PL171 TaxID=765915 RepID=A0A1Y2HJE4_9FUNG|nr:P-loop containing nucleoside triphosphate hydrolase protein [Catenaria anguillulae PL171]